MKLAEFAKSINPIQRYKDYQANYINKIIIPYQVQINELKKSYGQAKTYSTSPVPSRDYFSVDSSIIQDFSFQDNYVRAAINLLVDKIMSGGYIVDAKKDMEEGERQLEEFKAWEKIAGGNIIEHGEQINFNRVLRKTCISMIKGDDFFWELEIPRDANNAPMVVSNGIFMRPKAIHVRDWEEMVIKHDIHGRLIDLTIENGQRTDGPFKQVKGGRVVAIWDRWEIIHANYYGEGTSKYGNPLIRSILFAATTKRWAENFSSKIFEKHKTRGIWGLHLDELEAEKVKKQILDSASNPNTDIFYQTSMAQGELAPVTYQNLVTPKDLEYEASLTNSKEDIIVGMGVTGGSLGAPVKKSGWESQTELHELDEKVNSKRDFLERIINEILFMRFAWDAIELKFNRSNKRDEVHEAQIVSLLSDILTINERRLKLGYEEIEEGDIIIPLKQFGQGNSAGSESTEEMALSITSEPNNIIYKMPVNFKKSIDTRKNKRIGKPPIGEQKRIVFDKIFKFRNEYIKSLNNNLKVFIDEVISKIDNDLGNIKKRIDGSDEMKDIDKIAEDKKQLSRILAIGMVGKAYEFGMERATIETGVFLSKSNVDSDALRALENLNINIVEGAYSELANRIKTEIRLGLQAGESSRQVAARLRGINSLEETYKNRFQAIARTEMSRATIQGTLNNYAKSGVVDKVEPLIGLDPDGLCHEILEGKIFTLEEAMRTIPVHINCTCSFLPIPNK